MMENSHALSHFTLCFSFLEVFLYTFLSQSKTELNRSICDYIIYIRSVRVCLYIPMICYSIIFITLLSPTVYYILYTRVSSLFAEHYFVWECVRVFKIVENVYGGFTVYRTNIFGKKIRQKSAWKMILFCVSSEMWFVFAF